MGTELKKNSRNDVMDAIKAIAIISVICGHSCAVLPYTHLRIGRFVQLYHIMAFFFVSGYCFNEKKYENNLSFLMGSRLTKIVGLYFCYNAFFVCIHNLLSRLYLISDPLYSRNEILYHILSGGFYLYWFFLFFIWGFYSSYPLRSSGDSAPIFSVVSWRSFAQQGAVS